MLASFQRYTWASERWRGCSWINKIEDSEYKPLTMLIRKDVGVSYDITRHGIEVVNEH